MANEDAALAELRRHIDMIDDQIHDLLMQRTEVVRQIGASKRHAGAAAFALRPAREAEIVRRLLRRHRGPLPKAVIVRLWRELLSAQVGVQGAFSVVVCASRETPELRDIAQDHFGACTPVVVYESPAQVLKAVSDGAAVGVLPIPDAEQEDPWWRSLMSTADGVPKVVARLPFAATRPGNSRRAYAVAAVAPEPSGDDVSLIAVEATTSRARIRELLIQTGMEPTWIAAAPSSGESRLHLVAVDGFLGGGDARLDRFLRSAGEDVLHSVPIGAYATPVADDEMVPPS